MNRQSTKKALIAPFMLMAVTAVILVVVWFVFNQLVAGIAAAILIVLIVANAFLLRQSLNKMDAYMNQLAGHISAGTDRAIRNLPIGMMVLDENEQIEWVNRFLSDRIERNVISDSVNEVYPNILRQLEKTDSIEITDDAYHYRVRYSEHDRVLYFFDITEEVTTNQMYEDAKPIICLLYTSDAADECVNV